MVSQTTFLHQLQQQAKLQSKLERHRVLPRRLDPLTSFIGNYPWQVLLVSSGITAVVWMILQNWDIPFI